MDVEGLAFDNGMQMQAKRIARRGKGTKMMESDREKKVKRKGVGRGTYTDEIYRRRAISCRSSSALRTTGPSFRSTCLLYGRSLCLHVLTG